MVSFGEIPYCVNILDVLGQSKSWGIWGMLMELWLWFGQYVACGCSSFALCAHGSSLFTLHAHGFATLCACGSTSLYTYGWSSCIWAHGPSLCTRGWGWRWQLSSAFSVIPAFSWSSACRQPRSPISLLPHCRILVFQQPAFISSHIRPLWSRLAGFLLV